MIGKTKTLNFTALLLLIIFSLIVNSFVFSNLLIIYYFLTFFLISLLITKYGLKIITQLNLFQNIRNEGPALHLIKKNTPTMGGIFIFFPFLLLLLVLKISFDSIGILLLFFCTLGFFITGFLDDYLSVSNKKNTGLKAIEKFLLQTFISILFITLAFQSNSIIPLISLSKELYIDTNLIIIPICFLTLVGLSNAVNLTDGLDGLAILPCVMVAAGLGIIGYLAGNIIYSEFLNIPYLPGTGEMIVFCGALVGSGIGFLWFNTYPAQVFMGDVGSLSLGASLGIVTVIIRHEYVLLVMGGLFVIEALSVIVQVISFKLTGKRVFNMAPLHHHYELKGWPEPRVIVRFWIITFMLVLLGLALLRLR